MWASHEGFYFIELVSNLSVTGSVIIFRGRGFTHVCVDHRPTKVLVSGYEEDEKPDVLAHFSVSP